MIQSITIIVVLVILFLILLDGLVIVHTGEVRIVELFGKYVKTLDPGIHFVIPIVYSARRRVSLKQTPITIDPQKVITKDNVIVEIDEALKYHVTNIKAYVYDNENSVISMIQDCQSNLRGIIGQMDLNQVLNGTEEINTNLYNSVKDITAGYGLSIDRINIGEISVSNEIVNSMNKLITASRDKESTITISEGNKQSVILQSEGAARKMEIDAQATAKQTLIAADAEASRIKTVTAAEVQRISDINNAIKDSQLNDEVIQYLGLQAFSDLAKSPTNTVVLPSNMSETIAQIPAMKALWEQTPTNK